MIGRIELFFVLKWFCIYIAGTVILICQCQCKLLVRRVFVLCSFLSAGVWHHSGYFSVRTIRHGSFRWTHGRSSARRRFCTGIRSVQTSCYGYLADVDLHFSVGTGLLTTSHCGTSFDSSACFDSVLWFHRSRCSTARPLCVCVQAEDEQRV